MSRTGVEPKPAWQTIPRDVRAATDAVLGGPIQRAARVWGGYTPTPTYRLRLADGRRAFFKAVGPDSNAFSRAARQREERVYQELADLIAPWAPAFLGAFASGSWQVVLLEDLGPKTVPPWTPGSARRIARSIGTFHGSTVGRALPDWLPDPERQPGVQERLWNQITQPDAWEAIANLAGHRADEAGRWLERAVPVLRSTGQLLPEATPPFGFLHRDLRSDNLRWRDGRLRLFDWPHVGIGPTEYDLAAFAQSVTAEGGPGPEQIVAWYVEENPLRSNVLDASVAALAGFFLNQAWRPPVPGLPRLRQFQRRQLGVTLAWASERLALPTPTWVAALTALKSNSGT
jgi:hypothetical protein